MADLWTAIDRHYKPGSNDIARRLVENCSRLGVTTLDQLTNPNLIGRKHLDPQSADLAMALVLLEGKPYDHLRPY
jgi:hypothetical protein